MSNETISCMHFVTAAKRMVHTVSILHSWYKLFVRSSSWFQNIRFKYVLFLILQRLCFWHDRKCVSLLLKLIYTELDIAFCTCITIVGSHVTSSAIVSDVISRTQTEQVRHGSMCEDRRFSVIYGFIMSCKKQNNLCSLVTNSSCAHLSVIWCLFNF